ncbi:MAG: hypothetical protein P8J93_06885 [SAR86 cluster bacterium]|nr:hypothetical protein [SAR86 cluster bacterium]
MTNEKDKYSKKAKKIADNVMKKSLLAENFINNSLLKIEKMISKPYNLDKENSKKKQERKS